VEYIQSFVIVPDSKSGIRFYPL